MLLAADAGPGGFGALIFFLFIFVAIALFVAMSKSMKRMRSHVDRGDFGDPESGEPGFGDQGGNEPGLGEQADRPRGDPGR